MKSASLVPDRAPLPAATPIIQYGPIVFDIPERQVPLEARVTVPEIGDNLPIILLSHGHGASNYLSSTRGYGPLVEFYGAHGFVVIQVTHQDSKTLVLDPEGPEGAVFWRSRALDFHAILDRLDQIEQQVPGLQGRLDHEKIAVVGHSMGGHTVSLLAGAIVRDIHSGERADLSDLRISAFVSIAPPGELAGAGDWLKNTYPESLDIDFSTMTRPVLVVVGTNDFNANFSGEKDWRANAYNLSPSPKTLLTVYGAEHIFGGISGWDAKETSDENPVLLAEMQRATWSYVRTALYPGDDAWQTLKDEIASDQNAFGKVVSK